MADENQTSPQGERFRNEVEKELAAKKAVDSQSIPKEEAVQTLPLENTTVPEQKKSESIQTVLNQVPTVEIVTKRQRMLSAIGYIFFLCVLPLALEPNSKFCKFHGKQSLVLLIVFQILFLVQIFSMLWIAQVFYWIFYVVDMILIIVGVIQASGGKKWKMPFIGDIAEKLEI